MNSFDNEPSFKYPLDLQRRKAELVARKDNILAEIELVNKLIVEYRTKCSHKPIEGVSSMAYAVHCQFCGDMIDSWL